MLGGGCPRPATAYALPDHIRRYLRERIVISNAYQDADANAEMGDDGAYSPVGSHRHMRVPCVLA